MTTMFVQLRRVVYLLVVLYFFSCEAQVIYGQKTAKCPELREEELEHAERIMNRSWFGPESPLADVRSPQVMLAGGKACLELWGKEEKECKENYLVMEKALNATIEVVRIINESRKEVDGGRVEYDCGAEGVKKFEKEFDKMKIEYDNAAGRVDVLVKNVSKTERECHAYVGNLRDPANQLKKALERYEGMVLRDPDYGNCDLEKRKDTLVDYTARSKEMEGVLEKLHNLSGKTHACRLQSNGGVGLLLLEKYEKFHKFCPEGNGGKENPGFAKVENEAKKGAKEIVPGPEKRQVVDIEAFNKTLLPLVKKHIKEVEKVEAKIKADAEIRKERRAREKQEAEERARREEEERKRRAEEEKKRKAEEAKRAEEEKAKEEAEKARKAAQKAREEEANRVAAENARMEAERLAKEKAKQKKDGSNSPALVHSSLILLVLSVLGCTLVC